MFTFPTLVFFISLASVAYYKYVSALFCLGFAWHTAKLVEYYYVRNLSNDSDANDSGRSEGVFEDGYSYSVDDDGNLSFTFRIKDPTGRELSRLKFIRKKFFKD